MAGEPGFEPRLTESESVVLPLNYSPSARAWKGGAEQCATVGCPRISASLLAAIDAGINTYGGAIFAACERLGAPSLWRKCLRGGTISVVLPLP